MQDQQLLSEYRRARSQQAFAELVRRYADVVYAAARRQVKVPAMAEDVAQAVFLLLSQKAGRIGRGELLPGWLLRATWFTSRRAVTAERRREYYERGAAAMRTEATEPAWDTYSEEIDAAMAKLGAAERSAVALRYFCGLSLREVGEQMGLSEDVARKRVDRGLEKLRTLLSKKVIAPSAAGLAVAMAANGAEAAPASVLAIATGQASASVVNLAGGVAKAMAWVKVKLVAVIVVAAAGAVGTGVVVESTARSSAPSGVLAADAPVTRPSKMDAYVASLKARGEPTTPTDIMRAPVPDNDNAVWYLKQAAAAIVPEHAGPRNSSVEYGPALPYGAEWDRQAEEMVQAHPRLFELAREARRHPKVDWGIRFEVVNGVNVPAFPPLSPHRALQNVLTDAILYHHFHGDDAAALETTQDTLFAADAIGECPQLIGHLMASIQRSFADERIQIIATGLTIQDAAHPSNPGATHPAKREQVEAIIRVLLDDEHLRQQYRQAFESERMVTLANNFHDHSPEGAAPGIDYFDVMDEAIEASRRPRLTPMPAQKGPRPGPFGGADRTNAGDSFSCHPQSSPGGNRPGGAALLERHRPLSGIAGGIGARVSSRSSGRSAGEGRPAAGLPAGRGRETADHLERRS